MRKESSSRDTGPTGYILSQDGHALLSRVVEQMQLLDRMNHAHVLYDIPDLQLTPGELLIHYHRMLRDMDSVMRGMRVQVR